MIYSIADDFKVPNKYVVRTRINGQYLRVTIIDSLKTMPIADVPGLFKYY